MSPYEQKFWASPSFLIFIRHDRPAISLFFCHAQREDKQKRQRVWSCAIAMYRDGKISDYLCSSLEEAFKLYPTLLPGAVSKAFKEK